ncbi:MsnO8 family LLM class oxidoreductase [Kibdelosporangium aridum]|uniref:MsnO8 family LLM class oxidoreductase n=1 Tax=Kibdelosporangium aridum TaxID=2030 RepID=A0A428Z0X0_KIBAR|nr:MsnO8 family LLM class oxidoreductase [Kibdelosporangium aridum]RSM78144.1 MsnO8 family LLM class oxidoreductase [Kibdelosporangium aridum]
MPLPLSVLDLAVIGPDTSPEQAIRDVVDVARTAEDHGYQRFWVAEHHAMPRTAGSSPAVLMAHIAARTSTLRVGSGGVMLPNHSPLVIAEQFAVLQALYGNRVDLGVGRSSAKTLVDEALHRHPRATSEFPEMIDELIGFLHRHWPDGHRFQSLELSPRVETPPEIFVLGASENGARVAAQRGLPFVYGHHLGRNITRPAAVDRYRAAFTPGPRGSRPYVIVSINVVSAETDADGEQEAMGIALAEVERTATVPLVESRVHHLAHRALDEGQVVYGGPATVHTQIHELATTLGADEIMLVPYDLTGAGRSRTLRLLAQTQPVSATNGRVPVG